MYLCAYINIYVSYLPIYTYIYVCVYTCTANRRTESLHTPAQTYTHSITHTYTYIHTQDRIMTMCRGPRNFQARTPSSLEPPPISPRSYFCNFCFTSQCSRTGIPLPRTVAFIPSPISALDPTLLLPLPLPLSASLGAAGH